MSYYHLTTEDRKSIERFYKAGLGVREIARCLCVSPSTISREFQRNHSRDEGYNAIGAQRKSNRRRRNCGRKSKLSQNQTLYETVCAGLDNYWSPEEIANTLPLEMRISVSTIYRAIHNKSIPQAQRCKLRRYRKYNKHGKKKGCGYDFSKVRKIKSRNKSVLTRCNYGHWELDTIVLHPGNGFHLATFVERKSRTTIIRKLANKKATTMSDAIIAAFEHVPKRFLKTLTVDRGLEFTDWERVELTLGVKVYFCDPYSPWQRGANENTNGLIRQFFPRGVVYANTSDKDILQIQNLLNARPRKCLQWKSPSCFFCCT